MSIEEDIKQAKFKSEYEKGLVNLLYTYHWINDRSKEYFKKHDLTNQQYNILRILRGSNPKPCTINDLKERMLDKMSDASRLVDRLIKKGLVKKNQLKEDRRVSNIYITDTGLHLLTTIDKEINSIDELLSNLDEKEIKQFNFLLDKIRDKEF